MSTGHHKDFERRTPAEFYLIAGEADTAKWLAKPKRLVTNKDVPYGGGASVDAEELYIDEQLYREIMRDKASPPHLHVIIPGMTGKQIVRVTVKHEGTEIAVELGDNPCDTYQACHGMATCAEEDDVEAILGKGKADFYEARYRPALIRCVRRSLNKIRVGTFNPPKKLWCGPYLDDPTPDDRKLIRGFKACGVTDAFKLAKSDPTVMYGMGGEKCRDCQMMEKPKLELSPCDLVCGMVRWNRNCERYVERR